LGGAKTDANIKELFGSDKKAVEYMNNTLEKDPAKTQDDAFVEIHKKLRDGELANVDNAKEFIGSIFNSERYDLSEVGRFRFNQRFKKSLDPSAIDERVITLDDMVTIVKNIVHLNETPGSRSDDIDDLRLFPVGPFLQFPERDPESRTYLVKGLDPDVAPVSFFQPAEAVIGNGIPAEYIDQPRMEFLQRQFQRILPDIPDLLIFFF